MCIRDSIYAVFLLFIVANIIMIPLGILCIKAAKRILRVPREILMPLILLFCIVGTFAINNTVFEVGVMLVAGIIAYLLEANRFPIAPAILGVVLGGMLEENFITSMIKSNGDLGAFFTRPIALGLAAVTVVVWFAPLVMRAFRSARSRRSWSRAISWAIPPTGCNCSGRTSAIWRAGR